MATAMIASTPARCFGPRESRGGAGEKKPTKRQRARSRLAYGVMKPTSKAAPDKVSPRHMAQRDGARSRLPDRHSTPVAATSPPTDARSKSRPIPGPPSGKVENSRCRGTSEVRAGKSRTKRGGYKGVALGETPHSGIFE